jgi:hypothetical protein
MKNIYNRLIILFFTLSISISTIAQEWEPAMKKDGIFVYTREESTSNCKAFKGETEVHAELSAVIDLIENVKNFDRWDESVSEIQVLEHEAGRMIKYYVVYDVPWPFKDRDLCVEANISSDQDTGARLFVAKSAPAAVPLNDDNVRITDYWQKWIIRSMDNGYIHLTVEGFADPAGDIPSWIVNMAITDTPFNMLKSIRENL